MHIVCHWELIGQLGVLYVSMILLTPQVTYIACPSVGPDQKEALSQETIKRTTYVLHTTGHQLLTASHNALALNTTCTYEHTLVTYNINAL